MAKQRESALSSKIKKWLTEQGWKAWKNSGTLFQEAGRPDIMAIKKNRVIVSAKINDEGKLKFIWSDRTAFLAIETKLPGEEPTALQQKWLDEASEQGADAFCAHSLDEVKAEMKRRGLA